MNVIELRKRIDSLCTHITFEFQGKDCGVDPFSHDNFEMWYGNKVMTAKSIDEVMTTPFFDGHPLKDIMDEMNNLEI